MKRGIMQIKGTFLQRVWQGTKQSILPNFLPNHTFSIDTSISFLEPQ
jgi:hypothetical protein